MPDPGGETEAAPGCRIGRLGAHDVVPGTLREVSWAFSAHDRVLGFYGSLRTDADGGMFLVDVLVCVTEVDITGRRPLTPRILGLLTDHGWQPSLTAPSSRWHRHAWELEALRDAEGAHLALSLGAGRRHLSHHLYDTVPRHAEVLRTQLSPRAASRREGAAAPRAATSDPVQVRGRSVTTVDVDRATEQLAAGGVTVLAGAGISVDSGIPCLSGPDGLDERLGLREPFPGDFVAGIVATPGDVVQGFGRFQAAMVEAEPSETHHLLAALQVDGCLGPVLTSNLDLLLQAAGARLVVDARDPRAAAIAGSATTLLVLGTSDDSLGLVDGARAAGAHVLWVDPVAPRHTKPHDSYVAADARALLRALATRRPGLDVGPGPDAILPPRGSPLSPRARHARRRAAAAVMAALSATAPSTVHGPRHAQETAWLGLRLLELSPDADPAVVLMFAVVHDAWRRTDGRDPDHGRRAAAVVRSMEARQLGLTRQQRAVLADACEGHGDGTTTSQITIAACWDADRLGLWRVGLVPRTELLSLSSSRYPPTLAWARTARRRPPAWSRLLDAYAVRTSP